MATTSKLMQAAAGLDTGPEGAWDLSYAYYDDPFLWRMQGVTYEGESTNTISAGVTGVTFKPDGLKFYMVSYVTGSVTCYSIGMAWSVYNATLTNVNSFSVSAQEGSPSGIAFDATGDTLFITGSTSDSVHEYALSTAWDVSTASYTQSVSVSTQTTNPRGLFFRPDGLGFYIVSSTDIVFEYSLSTAWDISTAAYVQSCSVTASGTGAEEVFFKPDGLTMFIQDISNDRIHEYALSTAWDVSTASYTGRFTTIIVDSNAMGVCFKTDGSRMFVFGQTTRKAHQYVLGGFSVTAQETAPVGLFLHPEGTKMYVIGFANDSVQEYSLSTAWDMSSAAHVRSFSVAAQETTPRCVFFHPDGIKMYVLGSSGRTVDEYALSTAWNISTSTYVQSFSVIGQDTTPQGISFKPDGTKMYVVGSSSNSIFEYSLSTAWDISTAAYVQSFSVNAQVGVATDIFFHPDGNLVYVSGGSGSSIFEYALSTAWNISTSTYVQSFSVIGQESQVNGVSFKDDGTRMYALGYAQDRIYTYTLGVQA